MNTKRLLLTAFIILFSVAGALSTIAGALVWALIYFMTVLALVFIQSGSSNETIWGEDDEEH